jgi:hypothetical protein
VNRPGTTPSIEAVPLGDVGDPPQAENSVASVAPDATWQAPAQNRRRETFVFASDIVVTLVRVPMPSRQDQGHAQNRSVFLISGP